MRRPFRLLRTVVTTLSLTGATTAAIGYHLLAQPVRPVPVSALPASNPASITIPAGRCRVESEINGRALVCAIDGPIVTFPPMLTAPIATAVVSNTAGNPPSQYGGAL